MTSAKLLPYLQAETLADRATELHLTTRTPNGSGSPLRFRGLILQLPKNHPTYFLCTASDFYSRSSVSDLCFNPVETVFPVKEALSKHRLGCALFVSARVVNPKGGFMKWVSPMFPISMHGKQPQTTFPAPSPTCTG